MNPGRPFLLNTPALIRQSPDPEAALAYILGLLSTTFVLDSLNHPAIFRVSGRIRAEPQRDRVGMGPGADGRAGQGSAPHPLDGASDDFARVLPGDRAVSFDVRPRDIEQSLKTMTGLLDLFVAPGAAKRSLILGVMGLGRVRKSEGGLIINREPNPRCADFIQQRMAGMDEAAVLSVRSDPRIRRDAEHVMSRWIRGMTKTTSRG